MKIALVKALESPPICIDQGGVGWHAFCVTAVAMSERLRLATIQPTWENETEDETSTNTFPVRPTWNMTSSGDSTTPSSTSDAANRAKSVSLMGAAGSSVSDGTRSSTMLHSASSSSSSTASQTHMHAYTHKQVE